MCPPLSASHCFPYVKKRIEVVSEETIDLTPIEVLVGRICGLQVSKSTSLIVGLDMH